jgi:hypothetical protein
VRGRSRKRFAGTLASTAVIVGLAVGNAPAAVANTLTPQQAVDQGVANASNDGVNQFVALVDRSTGELVASSGGDTQVISESIVKLFTVSYYLVEYDGKLPATMSADLHEMIVHSDDRIESEYWTMAAVPAMAKRYGLKHTANGAKTGPHDWGWEYITADDEATFLYQASQDPIVGPFLMDAMAEVAPVGADGFNQDFGFNSLDGDHGSKQGWTDLDTSQAINIHSVGWTDRYFGAILETSDSPQYNTMRADSTITADLIQGAQSAGQIAAARAAAAATAAQAAAVVAAARSALTSTGSQVQRVIQHVLRAAGLIG